MLRDTRALWARLHRLTPDDLNRPSAAVESSAAARADGAAGVSAILEDLLSFKADSVRDAAADLRRTLE